MTTETQSEKVVVTSSQLEGRTVTLSRGDATEWQRCPIADRILVVTDGAAYLFRSHGRDEERLEVSAGDVVHIRRMVWHRIVAAADQDFTGTLVTAMPADARYRL